MLNPASIGEVRHWYDLRRASQSTLQFIPNVFIMVDRAVKSIHTNPWKPHLYASYSFCHVGTREGPAGPTESTQLSKISLYVITLRPPFNGNKHKTCQTWSTWSMCPHTFGHIKVLQNLTLTVEKTSPTSAMPKMQNYAHSVPFSSPSSSYPFP